jgi:hypothetical protein
LGSRKKAPPFRPEGGAEPYLSYSGLLAEGSPVPSAPKTTRGAGDLFQKERPRRSGAKFTGHQLTEGGVFGPSELDNSAIRRAGTRFLRQRAVAARVLPWSNGYPFPMAIHRRRLDCGHKPIRPGQIGRVETPTPAAPAPTGAMGVCTGPKRQKEKNPTERFLSFLSSIGGLKPYSVP